MPPFSRFQEFEGRATAAAKYGDGPDYDDCGHGTHVAGIIGSATYGVAKKTNIYAFKVLSYSAAKKKCIGDNSYIIQAVNDIASDAANRSCPKGVFVNMSLGGDYSKALNDAVNSLAKSGVFVGVAAGNENQDASNVSPASAANACCIGGTDVNDYRYVNSNYGANVDVAAPGVNVLSTWPNGETVSPSFPGLARPLLPLLDSV